MPMPRKPANKKNVNACISLRPELMTRLRSTLQPGESLSALIGRLIEAGLVLEDELKSTD